MTFHAREGPYTSEQLTAKKDENLDGRLVPLHTSWRRFLCSSKFSLFISSPMLVSVALNHLTKHLDELVPSAWANLGELNEQVVLVTGSD